MRHPFCSALTLSFIYPRLFFQWDTTIGRWDYVETIKESPEKPEKVKCCRLSSKNKLLTGSYAKLKLALRDFRN